tara:strand:+ start:413 stop:610 length:198 start_codon:yes stop_codon:yes gene_type:complete
MASKTSYLIKVWRLSKKDKSDSTLDGFELSQEEIIKCYEKDIKNIRVAKGYRATYEECKETHQTK